MPVLPHNFPTLRREEPGNPRPSVLILGAGMSHDLVPLPGQLLAEKREAAERKLECTSTVPVDSNPTPNHLYQWADDIRTQLIARGDPNPKLTLAQSLDIPSDPCWLARVSTHRNKARHRVIARFAREGLWDQIWSLNWDCVQERAFENVGLKRNGTDALLPWPTVFRSFTTTAQCAQVAERYSVTILKPHGCVMALLDAEAAERKGEITPSIQLSERFLITATELENLAPSLGGDGTQQFIFSTLCEKLCSHPFVVAGWRATEEYLLAHIDSRVRPALEERFPLPADELSIIDSTFNDGGHTRLASFYGKEKNNSHIPVEKTGFTDDKLFLWLQALYAVQCLNLRALPADKTAFVELLAEIRQPPNMPAFVIEWADNFLPVWVRLCWRCGLIRCQNRNYQQISVNDINLEERDEHIPWALFDAGIDRPELITAARFLAALHRSGNADKWDYKKFPGGLYRDNQLVIPLPAWNVKALNDLQGLKPLIDSIKQHEAGYIDKMAVLSIGQDSGEVVPDESKQILRELVSRELAMRRFTRGCDIEEIGMEDL